MNKHTGRAETEGALIVADVCDMNPQIKKPLWPIHSQIIISWAALGGQHLPLTDLGYQLLSLTGYNFRQAFSSLSSFTCHLKEFFINIGKEVVF